MGSEIRQRGKKGTWWYYGFWNGRPHRFSLRLTNKREAEAKKRNWDVRLSDSDYRATKKKNPTCQEHWEKHKAWMQEHREPRTLETHEMFWNQLLEFTKARRLGDIGKENIEQFKKHRKQEGNGNQTVNNGLKDIQAIYNRAIKEGWYTGTNPVIGVERYPVTQKVRDSHSKEELERLVSLAEERDRCLHWIVLLLGYAGLRRKELVYLKWDLCFDWNSKKPLIKIVAHEDFKIKTHQERNIPMPRVIYEAMAPYAEESGYVFESNVPNGGKHRYRYDPRKALTTLLKDAGLTTNDPFQRLRRTFGSIHIARGRPAGIVAAWMGNSESVIRKHYAGLMPYDSQIDDV